MTENTQSTVEWTHCNQCLRQTRHEILMNRVLNEPQEIDDGIFIDWGNHLHHAGMSRLWFRNTASLLQVPGPWI
jgi:hypothetical protein